MVKSRAQRVRVLRNPTDNEEILVPEERRGDSYE
jgi:hypothetical protein